MNRLQLVSLPIRQHDLCSRFIRAITLMVDVLRLSGKDVQGFGSIPLLSGRVITGTSLHPTKRNSSGRQPGAGSPADSFHQPPNVARLRRPRKRIDEPFTAKNYSTMSNYKSTDHPQSFRVSASGIFRVYIPSIENYEQAVGLYLAALQIERGDPDSDVQREGMLKGAIVFAMMSVEAQLAHVVRMHVEHAAKDQAMRRLIERQLSEPLSPRRMLSQWAYDLLGVRIDTSERKKEPLRTYFELVDYRNATIHSDWNKHELIRKWTRQRKALQALRNGRDMVRKLNELFQAREDYVVRWIEQIYSKAESATSSVQDTLN